MSIIEYEPESYGLTDIYCNPLPAFKTRGCGCCSGYKKVTAETIAEAIQEAEEWLAELRSLEPADYSTLDE